MAVKKSDAPIQVTRSSMPPFDEYVEEIRELWETHWLTNSGVKHQKLEKLLREYLQAEYVGLYTNGHMALECALEALQLKGEVITTPYTYASTTHAIVRRGLTPVFCDIDPITLCMDPQKIEPLITEKTCAILPVHVYGIPCDVEAIQKIAEKHHLKVIYDAAHAFGVRLNGRPISQYGDVSMFSFHATKVFHTVEGGGLVFQNKEDFERAEYLKKFGMRSEDDVPVAGLNAKMTEVHAAMGICNMRHIDEEIGKREKAVARYTERLQGTKGLQLFPNIEGLQRNYSYFPVVFHEEFGKNREEVLEELGKNSIFARRYFYPATNEFQWCRENYDGGNTPIAHDIAGKVLCLPLYAGLSQEDVDRICDCILA